MFAVDEEFRAEKTVDGKRETVYVSFDEFDLTRFVQQYERGHQVKLTIMHTLRRGKVAASEMTSAPKQGAWFIKVLTPGKGWEYRLTAPSVHDAEREAEKLRIIDPKKWVTLASVVAS